MIIDDHICSYMIIYHHIYKYTCIYDEELWLWPGTQKQLAEIPETKSLQKNEFLPAGLARAGLALARQPGPAKLFSINFGNT